MSEARQRILAALQRDLAWQGEQTQERLRNPPRHPGLDLPADRSALLERFVDQLEALDVAVTRLPDLEALPKLVERLTNEHQRASTSHCLRRGLDLPGTRNEGHESPLLVTGADAGIAETGTLLIAVDQPHESRALFLAEHHLAVLSEEQVLASLEDAWHWLRVRSPKPARSHFITGPSKTADVEQTLVVGAHGPVALHVALIARH